MGKVCTPDWETEFFRFLKGVFQGDPFSGIIFLIVFNPIIEHIKIYKQTHGYTIRTETKGAHPVITTPFADDFNLITHDNASSTPIRHRNKNKINGFGNKT